MPSMSLVHCELTLEPQFSPWLVAEQEAAGGNALVQLATGPGPMTSLTQRSVLQGQVSAEAHCALKLCGPFSMGHGQPVGLGHIRDLPGHSISCTPSSVLRHSTLVILCQLTTFKVGHLCPKYWPHLPSSHSPNLS